MDARDSRDAVRRLRRGVHLTLPVVLASAMTVTMNLTVPVESADAAPQKPLQPRSAIGRSTLPRPAAATTPAIQAAAVAPQHYTVVAGDSVSAIAERFGLSTASVLARNGLGWKSLIFPGQVLTLTADAPAAPRPVAAQPVAAVSPAPARAAGTAYTIVRGDTISAIAQRFGVSTQSVLDANGLTRASVIYPGRTLTIPGGSAPAAQGDIQLVADVTPIAPTSAPAAGPATTGYTIKTGDTISSIAAAHGVSAAAILQANGLGAGSIIYAGRTLAIPASAAASATTGALTAEMAGNARTIITVGRQLGVPDRGIVIALATAMQESGLRNLPHGDRDSVGVFQQRPSTGWGQPAQLMDVAYAARLFYGGPANPNAGRTKGLLDIPGWSSMPLTQAAQRVQISAFPDAYAQWESRAVNWLSQLG
ncbi:MAG TPA: LysM peptidoglycan-binding domain-containing protein [Pseudolysinimonas sp.]|nr:LysM peptidoglycan-binding domain-containing protein [Pseudolysinimonas sp.]